MPYSSIAQLPESVKSNLPAHAQDIYKEAFNSAYEEYKDEADDLEELAHRVAWSAVKKVYQKNNEGRWVRKKE